MTCDGSAIANNNNYIGSETMLVIKIVELKISDEAAAMLVLEDIIFAIIEI